MTKILIEKIKNQTVLINDAGIVDTVTATVDGFTCTYKQNTGASCTNGELASVWTITEDKNSNGVPDIGDLITIDTENFYVISNDGTNIIALAKYNLLVGNSYDGSTKTPLESPTGLQSETAKGYNGTSASTTNKWIGTVPFSTSNYWYDSTTSSLKLEYGTTYPTYVYDDNLIYYKSLISNNTQPLPQETDGF